MTFTFAAALAIQAAGVFAGSREPFIKLEASGEQGLNLYMDSLTGLAKLTIFDNKGAVLFKDNIRQKFDVRQKFDLSLVPEGKYAFEIEHGKQIKVYAFEINSGQIEMIAECYSLYRPTVTSKKGQIDVSYLNLNREKVEITLYGIYGRQLFQVNENGEQAIGRRFDVSRLAPGNYTVVVKSQERTFTEVIAVK